MRKLKLYLETSTWNFYFADDAPEKQAVTREFFELVFKGIYEVYISEVVLEEINKAPQEKKTRLKSLIERSAPLSLETTKEAGQLAKAYMDRGIIPVKKKEDALHIGIATVWEIDALITWNYRHLANVRKSELVQVVNLEFRYTKVLQIITPMEVSSYEDR